VLCLFLLEMGTTPARNLFATLGIIVANGYAHLIRTSFKPGTYVLFAVLCAAASYIAVPAVQRLAIPEASPAVLALT
jgi:hypothetical protein